MDTCESPKHPFDIFRLHFETAPSVIIYDNACKLHQYCLNREPQFFKHTLFAVNRFHWKGHVGCSSGYCLDTYRHSVDLRSINSQVNEQANAGLQRIRGQLAYMTLDNFMYTMSLFLCIKNKDKEEETRFIYTLIVVHSCILKNINFMKFVATSIWTTVRSVAKVLSKTWIWN